jgi:subtilisin family serine protease
VQVTPGHETETIDDLMERGDIEFAEQNYYVYGAEEPNEPDDPGYVYQWGLKPDAGIDAPGAWDITTGADSILIAVIDTGIDLDHPDLKDKIIGGFNFIDRSAKPEDDNGHGTHAAGIIAASTNNGIGLAGISWKSRIMPLKVLDAEQKGTVYNAVQAIGYAVDKGAKIVNMSFSFDKSVPCDDKVIKDAFGFANTRGVLLVIAAGNHEENQDSDVSCPASRDEAIAVGAVTIDEDLATTSNYGNLLDIVAPGQRIYSTVLTGTYDFKSGTSMAAPHVAGVAALIWSFKPSLKHTEVRDILQKTATNLGAAGWDEKFGWGRVNARQALEYFAINLDTPKYTFCVDDRGNMKPPSVVMPLTTGNSDVLTWTATITPAVTWINTTSPMSGTVSAVKSSSLELIPSKPISDSYGVYTTTLTVESDVPSSRDKAEFELTYAEVCLENYYLPVVIKQ